MESNNLTDSDNYGSIRDPLGRFTPGNGGRPVGSKNRARRELIRFVETNVADLQKEYNTLEAKDKLRFLQSVMAFVIPRLQSETDSEGNDLKPIPEIEWSKLSENTLREILEHTSLNPSNNHED